MHPDAPLIGETLLLFCDLSTGAIERQAVKGLQHKGSFESSLQIRCDGRRVEVSGNPSKWGRRDNVFGVASVLDGLEIFNSVLVTLGLPPFTWDKRDALETWQFQGSETVLPEGCVITRVDLCRNFAAGSAHAARAVVGALGSVVRQGRPGWVSPDGNTVAWGVGSRYVYLKYYLKGPELRKHADKSDSYLAELAGWCDTVGLVRQEVSLKSMFLKRHGLDNPRRWSSTKAAAILSDYAAHESAGASSCTFAELGQTLLDMGASPSRARAAQTALYAYLAGHKFEVGENISKSAFYRLRADVLVAGVDLAAPLNVSTIPTRVRELVLSPAAAPSWYRWVG